MSSLKLSVDGLTKVWKVKGSCVPFYDGGKIEASKDENGLVCLHDDDVRVISFADGVLNEGRDGYGYTIRSLLSTEASDSGNEVITCFAMHPNSREIVVATQNHLLRHWKTVSDVSDSDSGERKESERHEWNPVCVRAIRGGHRMPVRSMDYDSTGTLVATGSADRSVRVWDIPKGYCTHAFRKHTDVVQLVRFHPDADRLMLFSCGDDCTVRAYDLRRSVCIATFSEHVAVPADFAISPFSLSLAQDMMQRSRRGSDTAGNLLVSCGRDKVLNFYELKSMQHVRTVPIMEELSAVVILSQEDSDGILSAANVSSNGGSSSNSTTAVGRVGSHVVITAGDRGTLRLYRVDMKMGDLGSFLITQLVNLPLTVFRSLSSEGRVTTHKQGSRSYAAYVATARPPAAGGSSVSDASFSSANQQLISQKISTRIDGGEGRDAYGANEDEDADQSVDDSAAAVLRAVTRMQYLIKTRQIVVVTAENNVMMFRLADIRGAVNASFHKNDSVSSVSHLQASRLLVGSLGDVLDMRVVPVSLSGSVSEMQSSSATAAAPLLAVVSNSPQVKLLQVRDQQQGKSGSEQSAGVFQCVGLLEGHTDVVLAVDISPDGQWLVTSSKDNTVRMWHVRSRVCSGVALGHTDSVGAVAFSQRILPYQEATNGTTGFAFLVSAAADKILKKWTLPLGFMAGSSLPSENGGSSAAAAAANLGGSAQLPSMCRLVASYHVRAHDKDVNSVAVSPNDAFVATASQDKTVKLWAVEAGPIGALKLVATLTGHKRGVWKVVFSPIDRVLASASGDRTLKLWSLSDHSCLRTFEGHTASVLNLKFVNKGLQIMSSAADGLLRLWSVRAPAGGAASSSSSSAAMNAHDEENYYQSEAALQEGIFDAHNDKIWALEYAPVPLAANQAGAAGKEKKGTHSAETKVKKGSSRAVEDHTAGFMFSGGSDGKLVMWRDATHEEEQHRLEAREEGLLIEQQLHTDLLNKNFHRALNAALELGHSIKTLTIFTSILEEERVPIEQDGETSANLTASGGESAEDGAYTDSETSHDSETRHSAATASLSSAAQLMQHVDDANAFLEFNRDWSLRLDEYVRALDAEKVALLIEFAKEWNTNARYSYVTQVLIGSLMRVVKVQGMIFLGDPQISEQEGEGGGGRGRVNNTVDKRVQRVIENALPGLLAYSERHFQRLDRLCQASYMLEYCANSMSLLPLPSEQTARFTARKASTGTRAGAGFVSAPGGEDDDNSLVIFKPDADSSDESQGEREETLAEEQLVAEEGVLEKQSSSKRKSSSSELVTSGRMAGAASKSGHKKRRQSSAGNSSASGSSLKRKHRVSM